MLNEALAQMDIQHSTFNIQHSRLLLPRGRELTFGAAPLVMGILNVTPDSISAGADMINDVSALRYSAGMPGIAARAGVPVILMHMRGEPSTMQQYAKYGDVVAEVGQELQDFVDDARAAGVEQLLVDPGIGF